MKPITLSLACIGLSLLTACQSTDKPPMTTSMEVNQQTQYFVEAKIALDKLKQEINQGREGQLAYFAPNTFKEAIAEFDNATEEYMDIGKNGVSSLNIFQSQTEQYKEAKQEIMNYVALSNQKLKFAYSIKETSESTLAETFTQKELLQSIGAPKLYSNDYKKINLRIHALVKKIDEGEVTKAQEKQPALLVDMHALELRTVRKNALGQLDKDIALIKKKNFAKFVPISFQELLTARNNADVIITNDPRAKAEIKTAVDIANFKLAHLYHIAKEVSELQQTTDKSYEQYLLANEALLHTVSEALGTADVRDLALTKQIESIALQAGTLKGNLTTANAVVLALQSDNSQTSAAAESLKADFKSQLTNLTEKYDSLVIENAKLNKEVQSKNIELVRLQAYKEAVLQLESRHAADKALALKVQAQEKAEQKALALKKQAEKEALALAEKTKKEAEIKALAQEEKAKEEAAALAEKSKKEAVVEEQKMKEEATAIEEVIQEAAEEQESLLQPAVDEVIQPAEPEVVKTIEPSIASIESN
jgi:hypothetical protein